MNIFSLNRKHSKWQRQARKKIRRQKKLIKRAKIKRAFSF